jgi:hypothetical protein
MTLAELTKVVEDGKPISMIVAHKDVWPMFPGPSLHPAAREFQAAYFSVGGPPFTPGGSSHEDQLLTFCRKHHLSYKLIGNRYLFTRGLPSAIVEGLVRELGTGESEPPLPPPAKA